MLHCHQFTLIINVIQKPVSDEKIKFTKKMGHYFLQSPSSYSISDAIRYGWVIGLGGDLRLVEAIQNTRSVGYNDFWVSVLQFFIRNPMFDRHQVGPLIDYINNQKFRGNPPPQPGFSMKQRDPETLMEQMENWHMRLAKQTPRKFMEWSPIGVRDFKKEVGIPGKRSFRTISIVELLNSKQLTEEGKAMKHCVGSYSQSCHSGKTSIWSLRIDQHERRVTIELSKELRIGQVERSCNRRPEEKDWEWIHEWASKEGLYVR